MVSGMALQAEMKQDGPLRLKFPSKPCLLIPVAILGVLTFKEILAVMMNELAGSLGILFKIPVLPVKSPGSKTFKLAEGSILFLPSH